MTISPTSASDAEASRAVSSGAIADIDLAALAANYRLLASKVAPKPCAAVVKANAYGLGIKQVALALQRAGCSRFFVATIVEGIQLRHVLPMAHIAVFYGIASQEDVELAVAHKLLPSINSLEQLALWQSAAKMRGTPLPACLHVDTGMNRLGLSHMEVEQLANQPEMLEGVEVQWLMSHLACASEQDHPLNLQQLKAFEQVREVFPQWPTSFANSSGIFLGAGYHGDMARPGAALYGINPTPHLPNPMQTVVTVKAPVLQTRQVINTETVGYGGTYTAAAGSRLATVACGYADGLVRSMSNAAQAFVAGKRVPVAGVVSMDATVLDITALPEGAIKPGDLVQFIGPDMPVDEVAEAASTIGYELLTSLGGRVRRNYIL